MYIPALVPVNQTTLPSYGYARHFAGKQGRAEGTVFHSQPLGLVKTPVADGGGGSAIDPTERAHGQEVPQTHKRGSIREFIKTWLPFINELANILEHSLRYFNKSLLGWFYPDFDLKNPATYIRMLIDTIALGAIAWNGADEADKGSYATFMKSMGLTNFSFVIPTFFIPLFQALVTNQVFKRLGMPMGGVWEGISRLGSGALAVVLLEAGVKIWDHHFTPWVKDKFVPWLNKIFHGQKHSRPTESVPSG